MRLSVLSRKLHYWIAFAASAPLLVIVGSGILLQTKKHWSWVQPTEVRGTGTQPVLDLEGVRAAAGVQWSEVNRIDVRPSRGVAKVWLLTGWEVQIDLGTGAELHRAYRRSDLIESIHDGTFFGGNWTKLGLFLPTGIALGLLWLTGLTMWWVTWAAKRRRAKVASVPAM